MTLLIYPLMINMSKDIKQNDLEFYESVCCIIDRKKIDFDCCSMIEN